MREFARHLRPEAFASAVELKTIWRSPLLHSGAVHKLPASEINLNSKMGGDTVGLPFFEVDESGGHRRDVAMLNARGRAWGVNDLSGDMETIEDMAADYWGGRFKDVMMSSLRGAVAGNPDLCHDISNRRGTHAKLSYSTIVEAVAHLGCRAHVVVTPRVAKVVPAGRGLFHHDDPPVDGAYTSYLLGEGAIGYAEGRPRTPIGIDTDSLRGDPILVSRRYFILHPRGVKWRGTPEGIAPTNTELAVGTNWLRVYDPSDVRILAFRHRL